MSIFDELAAADKKGLFTSEDDYVMYSTGILPLDYANGFWQEVKNADGTITQVPVLGIMGGTFVSIIGTTGGGKSIPDSTILPTPKGSRQADTLVVGDELFDLHGKPTTIDGVFPHGMKDTYEVTFSDGRKSKCSYDHLWTICENGEMRTVPLSEMYPRYNQDNYDYHPNLYQIPQPRGVQYPTQPVPVDPYVLGTYLAFGCYDELEFTLNPNTSDVVYNTIARLLNAERCQVNLHNGSIRLYKDQECTQPIYTADVFHDLGYVPTEIPAIYIENNIYTRSDLISGLLGKHLSTILFMGRLPHLLFITSRTNLFKSINDLIYSLGYSTHTSDGKHLYLMTVHSRKTMTITDITKLDYQCNQRCFMVNNPEHLYLTEQYIPTHNTTFAELVAWNIVKEFEDGIMFLIDAEKTASKPRMIQVTGADYNDPRVRLIKSNTSIEDVLEMFDKICKLKESGGKKYKYVTNMPTHDGKPVMAYVPTVFIIDSLPQFNSKNYTVEDLGTNADQMRAARDVTRFYTNCLDRAWKYNITFLVINHIRPKVELNQYAPMPKGLVMLGQNENLPRGAVAQYYSQTFFRINSKKSDAYTLEDDGFSGYKAMIQLAKSKTNTIGTSFPVALNGSMGFDPIYTLYEYAHAIGMIEGKNPRLKFIGLEQYPFSRKDFRKKFLNDEGFKLGVLAALKGPLESLLGPKPNMAEELGTIAAGDPLPQIAGGLLDSFSEE